MTKSAGTALTPEGADKLVALIKKTKGSPQSLRIIVKVKNKVIINKGFGKAAEFYDVGSMTKIMATTAICMKLTKEKKLKLNDSVEKYLPNFYGTKVGRIKIKDLLRHFSGLEAWRPFYKTLQKISLEDRKSALKEIFKKEKVRKQKKCVYSDLNFILLGWIIEEVLDMPLDEAAALYVFTPFKMQHTFFNPKDRMKSLNQFAPTEKTRARGLVKGFVFDDNCCSMGGIAGHAGLFSTIEDVMRMGDIFLKLYNQREKNLRLYTKRAIEKKRGDWGLGFTLPSRPMSSAGTKVSSKAFGHVGYPGTSFWIDPARQAVVTVLSNRTYPNKRNQRVWFFRREIHDCIWEIIDTHGK